jgi:alpha-D-xyloside xylohydrolase
MDFSADKKVQNIGNQFMFGPAFMVCYNYEKCAYSNIPFSYNATAGTLTIGERKGQFDGMLKERTFVIVSISKNKTQGLKYDAQGQHVSYNGHMQKIKL